MDVLLGGQDARLLRASFALAQHARTAGNHPFGAVLADDRGNILFEAGNTVVTENDPTGHAEMNLVRLVVRKVNQTMLAACTMYASTEPCPMCAGAIYWGNVGRLVYGLSQERLYRLPRRMPASGLRLACRDVLAMGARRVEVIGPALESEALEAHQGFW